VVTNKGTGLGAGALSHDEVVAVGREAGARLARLLRVVIPSLTDEAQSGSTK
jgi:purine nucleoside phosphorylase